MGKKKVALNRRTAVGQRVWSGGQKARSLILILLLAVLAGWGCGSPAVMEFQEGFQGMKWGTGPQEHEGLSPVAVEGDLQFYEKEEETPEFYGVALDRIVYGFYDGRMYAVFMYFHSAEKLDQLEQVLRKRWGPPSFRDEDSGRAFWNEDPVILLLTFDPSAEERGSLFGGGRLSIVYKPLQLEMEVRGEIP